MFNGVSCPGAADCWAAGVNTNSRGVTTTLTEHWNGSTWSVVPSPSVSGSTDTFLNGPSCTGPANCWAVGGAVISSSKELPIAEPWNGKKWSLTVLPQPAGLPDDGLAGASCPSAMSCWATGASAHVGFSSGPPLAEHWNEKAWAVVPTSKSSGNGGLNAVSCTSDTNCWAVGVGKTGALAEHWNGSAWSVVSTPAGGNDFFGDSCTGPD